MDGKQPASAGLSAQLEASGTAGPKSTVRPSLPLSLVCALALWLACAGLLSVGMGFDAKRWLAVGACGAVAALACAVGLVRSRRRSLFAALTGVFIGAALVGCVLCAQQLQAGEWEGSRKEVVIEALEDGSAGMFGTSATARATDAEGRAVKVSVRFSEDVGEVRYGDVMCAKVVFERPKEASRAYAWSSGCLLTAKVDKADRLEPAGLKGLVLAVRNAAIDRLEAVPNAGAPLVAALACGWRESLDDGLYQDFKACGLAHVVAVSGAHLSIVCALLGCLLKAVRVSKRVSIAIQALFVAAYVVLAGMPVSCLRAAAMTLAGLASFFVGRKAYALGALSWCIIVFLATDPWTALSVSFALSAASTLGIVLFSGLVGSWAETALPWVPRALREAVALTLASNVATLPLSAAWFSQVSIIAPLANAVVAPLFAPLCGACLVSVLLACAAPATASLVLGAACLFSELFSGVVSLLASVPYASVPASLSPGVGIAVAFALCALLWLWWPRLTGAGAVVCAASLAVALAVVVAVRPLLAADEIRMLDVGQGDAFVIRSRGCAVLVDTGNQDAKLVSALARAGIAHLDGVLVTHGDDDHMGSLTALDGIVGVERVFVAKDALSCGCDSCERLLRDASAVAGKDGIVGLSQGDSVQVGAFNLDVVWPQAFSDEGGNADSLCVLAKADVDGDGAGDWTTLMTGDAEAEQLSEMIEAGLVGRVDVYKVGHHGSKKALDDEAAQVLSPSLVLVSAGANNRYGHPAAETLERLEEVGASIARTDERGDVSCVFRRDGLEVACQR